MNELEKRAAYHRKRLKGLSPFCSLGEALPRMTPAEKKLNQLKDIINERYAEERGAHKKLASIFGSTLEVVFEDYCQDSIDFTITLQDDFSWSAGFYQLEDILDLSELDDNEIEWLINIVGDDDYYDIDVSSLLYDNDKNGKLGYKDKAALIDIIHEYWYESGNPYKETGNNWQSLLGWLGTSSIANWLLSEEDYDALSDMNNFEVPGKDMDESMNERMSRRDIDNNRIKIARAAGVTTGDIQLWDNGRFEIHNVKEDNLNRCLLGLRKIADNVRHYGGRYDFSKVPMPGSLYKRLFTIHGNLKEDMNEAKKKKKPYDSMNPDAGNVEHNIKMFNHANSPVDGPVNNPISGPMGGNVDGAATATACCESYTDGKETYYAAKYRGAFSDTLHKVYFSCDGDIEDAEKLLDELISEPYTDARVLGSVDKKSAERDGFTCIGDCDNKSLDDDFNMSARTLW
jgi:hypothetical protein